MTKAHILQEIKRTARANSDKPLGVGRFASETGIKKYDWYGIYWASWGDALQEAGYAPNQLQAAYGKSQLLESYAVFAMELGRLPAEGDLRLKSRHDKNFPSSRTFHDRLGQKQELVRQLAEYCRNLSGYQKVVNFCEQYAQKNVKKANDSENGKVEIGFVYLIKSGKYYKVGKSNAAGRRQYEFIQPKPPCRTPIERL